jgi:hypothetical protein
VNDLEELLARELGVVAQDVDAARTDLLGVRRVAAGERRRRRVLGAVGVVAAAAAVALVVTLATVLPSGGGDRVEPAGGGAAPLGLAWSDGDTVHLPSGRTVQVDDLDRVVASGSTVLVHSGPRWSVVDDAVADAPRAVPLTASTLGSPAVALGGAAIAWVEGGRGAFVVTSYDVRSATPTTTTLDPGTGAASLVGVSSVDDVGRVLVERRAGTPLLVTPGQGTAAVTLPPSVSGAALLPGGRALLVGEETDLLAGLASSGSAQVEAELAPTVVAGINPDASAYVALDPDGGVRLLPTASGPADAAALSLPAGADWQPAGWESVDDVVLTNGSRLVRCSVRSQTCDAVPGGMRAVAASL